MILIQKAHFLSNSSHLFWGLVRLISSDCHDFISSLLSLDSLNWYCLAKFKTLEGTGELFTSAAESMTREIAFVCTRSKAAFWKEEIHTRIHVVQMTLRGCVCILRLVCPRSFNTSVILIMSILGIFFLIAHKNTCPRKFLAGRSPGFSLTNETLLMPSWEERFLHLRDPAVIMVPRNQ